MHRMGSAPGARLSLAWRRTLVAILATAGVGGVLLELAAADQARLVYGGKLLLGAVAVVCLWLLADTLRPWLAGEQAAVEERAHADAAVRRAYAIVFWVAVAIVVYLQVAGATGLTAQGEDERAMHLLSLLLGLVLLLPLAVAAWDDVSPAGAVEEPLSPWSLTLARLRGPSARAHGFGLGAFAVAGALLLLLGVMPTSQSLLELASIIALTLVAGLTLLYLRSQVADPGDEHDRRG